ncbi:MULTISPECIES: thiol reductant ABC exporter subunit CydD [unclassified Paenibacillus]|uniref:thiol reductant ABC exporter subunit CydD n=1 Tax=unclassified Paenibacillus TaxID=185978 RepID=UPI0008399463|nr:thiol reductant ABC exporter subunit CydD [Paenibacillus sp. GM2]NWL87794.1 thiol reductant ABC exporter subunit CydD [Paenibacillus sp. 79R4]
MKEKRSLMAIQLTAQRKRLIYLSFISLALGAAVVSQAALLAEAVQQIFVEKASLSSVALLLGILLVVMTIRTLLSLGNATVGLQMAATAKTNMRAAVLENFMHASMPSSLQEQTGGKVSIALDAVDEADSYFSQYMPRMVEMAIIPILIIVVTFIQHANSGIIMLVTAPFIPIFMILIGLKTKNKSEEKYAQLAEFAGTFLDSLQGLVTLKIFGRARHQQQEIERSSLRYRDATMDILKIAFTNTFMLESIVMLSIGIVALELAIQLLVFKSMSFHTAFFVLLLVPEFYSLLKSSGTAFHNGRTSMGAVRKVETMLADTNDGNNLKDQPIGLQPFPKKLVPMPPTIELDNVRFQYAPDSFELNTGSITIGPGDHIALVGHSGSGKTTLLHLISGLLRPVSGTIWVSGIPLTQQNETRWFEHISYITQHPYIFAGTFADNIAVGAGRKVSRAEIEAAAADAGLSQVVSQLEQGIDTPVGEGGRGLSGGEKQRLAIARAFLKRPSIILFDEPTVGLDLHTEGILQHSIATLAKSATMITVAHRLYTIRNADNILFMDHGVLIGSGHHDALMKCLPAYAEMVDIQRKGGAR